MTIIHIVEAGGGVIEFIKYLIHFDFKNNHIVFCGQRALESLKSVEEFSRPNVEITEWKSVQREINIKQDFKAYLELKHFLKGFENEDYAIHLHSSKAGVLGRVWGRFNKSRKILYTPNGIAYSRKDISFLTKKKYQIIEFISSKLSGQVVCVSKSERDSYAVIDKNAIYINNGIIVNNSIVKPMLENKDMFTIITTGRITAQKNPAMFNEIAKHFKNNNNIRFVWIGEGELRDSLSSPNIEITGWLQKEEIYEELLGADLYLSTALWEGLPFAVLEAMNCHLPLLLYKSIGNVDLVKEDINGYLFDTPKRACYLIYELHNKREKRVLLGMESYKYLCSDFDAEKMAENYYENYSTSNSCK